MILITETGALADLLKNTRHPHNRAKLTVGICIGICNEWIINASTSRTDENINEIGAHLLLLVSDCFSYMRDKEALEGEVRGCMEPWHNYVESLKKVGEV